jgi:formiminoglutamase
MSRYFQLFTESDRDTNLSVREGETRLGQRVQIPQTQDWQEAIRQSDARFVLFGIPEDIGVRANFGIGGTQTAWAAAIKSLLNIQSTGTFPGSEMLVLGHFHFASFMESSQSANIAELRSLTAEIDTEVAPVVERIVAEGKIPIAIGGGHNNAYPLIQGASAGLQQQINCINLDAHSDYRLLEGRHSGNGFRYAHMAGYLDRYAVVGLHESYNAANIIAEFESEAHLHASFFEDIFIRQDTSFREALMQASEHVQARPVGIELDMDAIEGVLSSAQTPSGMGSRDARRYIHFCTQALRPCYLHLPEAAFSLEGRDAAAPLNGKLLAYLVADFVRGMSNGKS